MEGEKNQILPPLPRNVRLTCCWRRDVRDELAKEVKPNSPKSKDFTAQPPAAIRVDASPGLGFHDEPSRYDEKLGK